MSSKRKVSVQASDAAVKLIFGKVRALQQSRVLPDSAQLDIVRSCGGVVEY